MKYVILKAEVTPGVFRAFPVIFAGPLCHDDVAKAIARQIHYDVGVPAEVHSAGFCGISDGWLACTRGSETLKIARATERCHSDEQLIEFNDSTSGIMNMDMMPAPVQAPNKARAMACLKACAGLSQFALDGGWTAEGMNAYAKSLEVNVEKLRAALFGFLQIGPDQLDGFEHAVKSLSQNDPENSAVALAAIQVLRETQGGAR